MPRFKDLFLSPLTRAGPSVCTLAVWLLDFGFGRPETWKETEHVHEETQTTKVKRSGLLIGLKHGVLIRKETAVIHFMVTLPLFPHL